MDRKQIDKTKNVYWVQALYAVIAPDGKVNDYHFSKCVADKEARRLNREDNRDEQS